MVVLFVLMGPEIRAFSFMLLDDRPFGRSAARGIMAYRWGPGACGCIGGRSFRIGRGRAVSLLGARLFLWSLLAH